MPVYGNLNVTHSVRLHYSTRNPIIHFLPSRMRYYTVSMRKVEDMYSAGPDLSIFPKSAGNISHYSPTLSKHNHYHIIKLAIEIRNNLHTKRTQHIWKYEKDPLRPVEPGSIGFYTVQYVL